jgi:hypothetical protein
MEQKLSRIHSRWRRRIIRLYLCCLVFVDQCTARTFPRARIHWIGYHRRPRRPERLMAMLLFAFAMILLEPREFVLWSIEMGSALSVACVALTVYRLVPRKRGRWVG